LSDLYLIFIARQHAECNIVLPSLSVHPSASLSMTWYCIYTNAVIVKLLGPSGWGIILVVFDSVVTEFQEEP